MNWPAASEIENWAKTALALSALAGGIVAVVRKRMRIRKQEREMRELEAKALRYLVDAMHHVFEFINPETHVPINLTELTRQIVLIRAVRSELWTADGHALSAEVEAEIKKVMTRTQAIRLVKDRSGAPSWEVLSDESTDAKGE